MLECGCTSEETEGRTKEGYHQSSMVPYPLRVSVTKFRTLAEEMTVGRRVELAFFPVSKREWGAVYLCVLRLLQSCTPFSSLSMCIYSYSYCYHQTKRAKLVSSGMVVQKQTAGNIALKDISLNIDSWFSGAEYLRGSET
jgi:hypothetical protein